jgi:hypothetical protein
VCRCSANRAQAQPSNLEAIDALGELLLEVGDVENATKMLRMSIQLAPDINSGKYMYLGQTLEGADAVESFEQGIAIMEREVQQVQASACQHAASGGGAESSPQSQQELTDMRRGLCAGHCAIAEVLLPDADTTEHIYSRCEQALQRAQQVRFRRLNRDSRGVLCVVIFGTWAPIDAVWCGVAVIPAVG